MGLKMKQWINSINWWKVVNITLIMYFAIACYDGDTAGWRVFHAVMGGLTIWSFMQMGVNSHIRDLQILQNRIQRDEEMLKAKNESTN